MVRMEMAMETVGEIQPGLLTDHGQVVSSSVNVSYSLPKNFFFP